MNTLIKGKTRYIQKNRIQILKLIYVYIILALVSCDSKKADSDFYFPAEFEPHEAVWVGVFERPGRDTVSAEIVKALYNHVQVRLNYKTNSMKNEFSAFLDSMQIDTAKLQWIKDSLAFQWPRDPGPLFLMNKKGEQKIIDFGWNNYGQGFVYNFPMTDFDSLFDRTDRRMAALLQLPVESTAMVAEGGGIETNGKGVLMSTEETALQRNPGKTLQEIEKEYLRVSHCTKMIWLKRMTVHDKALKGMLLDKWFSGGANGHIDEVARFVNANTIVLAKIDEQEKNNNPFSKADYEILEECYATLKNATDADGKPFNIIRFPNPDLNVYSKIRVLDDKLRTRFPDSVTTAVNCDTLHYVPAVGYMNFIMSNGVVLIPFYWKEGLPLTEKKKDDEVKKLMQQLFPDREIIQINPIRINSGGGGIHCATLYQPKSPL